MMCRAMLFASHRPRDIDSDSEEFAVDSGTAEQRGYRCVALDGGLLSFAQASLLHTNF